MKTRVVSETPVAVLTASNIDGAGRSIRLFRSDIDLAPVGSFWSPEAPTEDMHSRHDEILTVVYKDTHGSAVMHKVWGTDSAGVGWQDDPELVWVERTK